MFDLTDRRALVTGGSGGIGAEAAATLAARGADVALTYRNGRERANQAVSRVERAGRRGVALEVDVAERGASARVVDETVRVLGGLDIVVAAAGVSQMHALSDTDPDTLDDTLDVNVRGVVELVRAAVSHLDASGRVVLVGSIWGERSPFPSIGAYSASKAAVAGLARAWARELAPGGITVNTVQPGPIDTPQNPADPSVNPMAPAQIEHTAAGRYGTPAEVAALITYLASDEAAFVTGQAINIDGGWTA